MGGHRVRWDRQRMVDHQDQERGGLLSGEGGWLAMWAIGEKRVSLGSRVQSGIKEVRREAMRSAVERGGPSKNEEDRWRASP